MHLTSVHVGAFRAAKDILKMQLDGHRNGAAVDQDAVANVRMMLQELSSDVAPLVQAAPAPAFVQTEAKAPIAAGGRRYKIELPKVEQHDVNALAAELGLLGRISVTPIDAERHALILSTHESLDDIIAICSFVLNPDDLKIFEAPALTPEQRAIEAAARAA